MLFYVLFSYAFMSRLFVDALWSPAGKGLTSWLSFVMSKLWSCHFPIGILGQVWCLIVSIPDLCSLSYFVVKWLTLGNFIKLRLCRNVLVTRWTWTNLHKTDTFVKIPLFRFFYVIVLELYCFKRFGPQSGLTWYLSQINWGHMV